MVTATDRAHGQGMDGSVDASSQGRRAGGGHVRRNVAALASAPARARRELRPLEASQVRAFLAATASERPGPMYTVAVSTGLRLGELLALRWCDVDEDAATLTVRHTLDRTNRDLVEP